MMGMVKYAAKILTDESDINTRQNKVLGKDVIRKMKVLFNDKKGTTHQEFVTILYLYPSNNTNSERRP